MSRSIAAAPAAPTRCARERQLTGRPRHGRPRCLLLVVGLALLLTLGGSAASARAATAEPSAATPVATHAAQLTSGPGFQDRRQYVFTIGILARVSDRAITLRFEDGQTETYTLDAATTIRTQNGDAESLADLKVGNMVLVIAEENTPLALTVVNGGEAGFHEAGPADIRGHDDACGACGP
jgi:hypothetical protein